MVVADDFIDFLGEEVADGAFDEVGFIEDAGGRLHGGVIFLHFLPLFDEHGEVAHEVAGLHAEGGGTQDDAHAFGDAETFHDAAQPQAFLRFLDFFADAELVIAGHEDHVATGERDVGGDARSFVADGSFGDLHHDFGSHRVDGRDVLAGDFRFAGGFATAFDGFEFLVEGGWDGIPVMKKGVFLESEVDEHGFEAGLEVTDLAFENATDDVVGVTSFDGVFLEHAVFDQGDAGLEFFLIDDNLDAGAEVAPDAEEFFDGANHRFQLGFRGYG